MRSTGGHAGLCRWLSLLLLRGRLLRQGNIGVKGHATSYQANGEEHRDIRWCRVRR
jgi:hypothetical protein